MLREIVLDTEATGDNLQNGDRLTEVAAIELVDGLPTGKVFHAYINPERSVPKELTDSQGKVIPHPAYFTDEFMADKPVFTAIAKGLKAFIGDSPIVITCRTINGLTLDIDFLDMEIKKAGFAPIKAEQWINVRRWSEAMFGDDKASLNKILDHYKIDRSVRDKEGHSATLDARLLAAAYPKLLADYNKFKKALQPTPHSKKPLAP